MRFQKPVLDESKREEAFKTLNKLDPSVSWRDFTVQIVDKPPYGVVTLGGYPVVRYPKSKEAFDDFVLSIEPSQHLLCIPSADQFEEILERAKKEPMAFDLEDNSNLRVFHPGTKIISFGISFSDKAYSIPTSTPFVSEETAEIFINFMIQLLKSAKYLIMQNGNYDCSVICHLFPDRIKREDIKFRFDTMIAAHVVTGSGLPEYELGSLARRYANAPSWKGGPQEWLQEHYSRKKDRTYDRVPAYILLPYNRKDAWYTFKIYEALIAKIKEENLGKAYSYVHDRVTEVCYTMTWDGLPTDKFTLDYLSQRYIAKAEASKEILDGILMERVEKFVEDNDGQNAGINVKDFDWNLNSPQQMSALLFDILGLPVLSRTAKKGDPKTGTTQILKVANFDPPVFSGFITYKKWSKYEGYLKNYLKYSGQPAGETDSEDLYICHSGFNPIGTKTGRLASSKPNGQNISNKSGLKSCFCCPDRSEMIEWLYKTMSAKGMPTYIANKSAEELPDDEEDDENTEDED